jgi:hypothetical protein
MTTLLDPAPGHPPMVVFTILPGPSRKRSPHRYGYRLTYRAPEDGAVGCVMTWEVFGGRQAYQIALERREGGEMHCHCTCADAVYRAEDQGRFCKHVRGLLEFVRLTADTLTQVRPAVRLGA